MNTFLLMVATFIGKVAELGAGFMSLGSSYQPEVPEELK
ncbi:cyclic lactone autoinducer peptide [Clostridium sp. AF18-27]|nr:cyclic lactone autoinducer peptide [Enterocloster lavalensis]RHR49132.1 cyclic lactone autoinducer peptide [Clostridium sp. AF18-27]